MAITIFGQSVDGSKAARSPGTRRIGAQTPTPDPRARVILDSLRDVSAQEDMNLQPDPTLGAPFSSFPNNRLTVAQMGPGEPAENFPLGGEPRQWKYRVGWNFPTTPDTDRGINGELLRALADSSWLVRRLIEIRKAELCGLEWEIIGAGRTAKERKVNGDKADALIQHLTEWFKYPEAYYSFVTPDDLYNPATARQTQGATWQRRGLVDWADWLDAGLEDVFVGDWWTVWPQRTLGNEMLGLRRVDGQHIKALLDLDGRIPPPPMPAWQQYLYGVPRASWGADELYYWPRDVRNMTPYGYSHVQQALVAINLALRFDQWNTAAYTESTVPMGLLETPENYTVDQIKDVADFLNGAVNSLAARQQVYPVPAGTKWQPIKPFDFDEKFAMYTIEVLCGAFDVQPQELGFAPSRAGLGGSGFADTQAEIHRRKSLIPTARWIERKITKVIHDQWRREGGELCEFRFTDIIAEDKNAIYTANQIGIQSGQVSLDAIAEDAGDEGPGYGRIYVAGGNILFLDKGFGIVNGQSVDLKPPVAPVAGALPPGSSPAGAPTDPTQDPGPPTPFPDAGKAAQSDDDRKKKEAAFIAAWLLWWKKKLTEIEAPSHPDAVTERFQLSPDEQTQLAHVLHETLRGPLYLAAFLLLRQRAGLPAGPSTSATRSDLFRLESGSQAHVHEVSTTYWSDLNTAAQSLMSETQDWPDQAARAQHITEGLVAWVTERNVWKARQIAITEGTDAEAQAQADFATQNPAVFLRFRWHAVLDEATCAVCAGLDGQVIDVQQGPLPPAHPNCRCSVTPIAQEPTRATSDHQPVLIPR